MGARILDDRGAKPAIVAGGALGAVGFARWAWKLTDLSLGSHAVANDFAVATRAVLIGMGMVLGVSFLVALAHPGGRVRQEKVEPDGAPVSSPNPS